MSTKPVLVIDGNVVGDITEQAVEDSVSVTADGSKTYSTLLNELYSQIDISKITEHTVIYKGDDNFWFNLSRMESDNTLHFGSVMNYGSYFRNFAIEINASASKYMRLDVQGGSNNTITDSSTATPASGTKIILYYGSSSIKADFETHANKCMMPDGVTSASDAIDTKINKTAIANNVTTTSEGYVLDARQGKALADGKVTAGTMGETVISLGFHPYSGDNYGLWVTTRTSSGSTKSYLISGAVQK